MSVHPRQVSITSASEWLEYLNIRKASISTVPSVMIDTTTAYFLQFKPDRLCLLIPGMPNQGQGKTRFSEIPVNIQKQAFRQTTIAYI